MAPNYQRRASLQARPMSPSQKGGGEMQKLTRMPRRSSIGTSAPMNMERRQRRASLGGGTAFGHIDVDETKLDALESYLNDVNFLSSSCNLCGTRVEQNMGFLLQCAKCKLVYYCSSKCFNMDMPQHRLVCNTDGLLPQYEAMGSQLDIQKRPPKVEEPTEFQIKVRLPDGYGKSLLKLDHITASTTIGSIKQKIASAIDIPVAMQQLILEDGFLELDHDVLSCKDYKIVNGSYLILKPTTLSIKVKMIPMNRYIKLSKLNPITTTVQNVKERIAAAAEQQESLPVERQVLIYNGKILTKPEKSLVDCKIKMGSTLYVKPARMTITIVNNNKEFDLEVETFDKVETVKTAIHEHPQGGNLAPSDQVLYFQGVELLHDDGGRTLQDYGVVEGSVLQLEPTKFEITAHVTNGSKQQQQIIPLRVHDVDTIDAVKELVAAKTVPSLPALQQSLSFLGNVINEGFFTLEQCGIQAGAVVEIKPAQWTLHVDYLNGGGESSTMIIEIQVDPWATIQDVKNLLEAKTGLPPSKQALFHNDGGGEELLDNNNKTPLADCGVKDGSRLSVESVDFPVTVELLHTGESLQLEDVSPDTTIDQLKQRIAEKSSLPAVKQCLFFNESELLQTNGTVADCGIDKQHNVVQVMPAKLPITVQLPNGDQLQLDVDGTDRVDQVLEMIDTLTGIPPHQVKLCHASSSSSSGNNELDTTKTLEQQGVEAGNVLQVQYKPFEIQVEDVKNDTVMNLTVQPDHTVGDVKEAIAQTTGLAPASQVLTYNNNGGKTLLLDKNDLSLDEVGVSAGSVLQVQPVTIPVHVELPNGETLELNVEPDVLVSEIKTEIQQESGIAPAKQKLLHNNKELTKGTLEQNGVGAGATLQVQHQPFGIHVELPNGKRVPLQVLPDDTIAGIKQLVQTESNIPRDHQRLFHNGNELETPYATLEDCGITEGSVIQVQRSIIPIQAKLPNGKLIGFEVDMLDPIDAVKQLIEDHHHGATLPAEQQRLFYQGNELADGDATVEDYNIKEGAVLDVQPGTLAIRVKVLPKGKTLQLEGVSPKDTIDQIKQMIQAEIPKLSRDNQCLTYKGRELTKGTLEDAGIPQGALLQVEPHAFAIKAQMANGKTVPLQVERTDTLDQIRDMIEAETGMPASQQSLYFGNKELKDGNAMLKDCKIGEGSTIQVQPNCWTIQVQQENGKSHSINIQPEDTLAQLKQAIQAKTNLSRDKQRLTHKGKELPAKESATVKELGITNGATLKLIPPKLQLTAEIQATGETVKLQVEPADTIRQVKQELAKKCPGAADQRLLVNGKELTNDSKTVAECGIKDGDTIQVKPEQVPIRVTMMSTGKSFTLQVTPSMDKLADVKQQVEETVGMPRKEQRIVFKDVPLVEDESKTLSDYRIGKNAELQIHPLTIPLKLRIPSKNKTFELKVDPYATTVDTIKATVDKHEQIPAAQQLLTFDKKALIHGRGTLASHGITKPNSVIDVGVMMGKELIKLFVHTPSGRVVELLMNSTDTIEQVKMLLQDKGGIAPNKQRIWYKDTELADDNMTLAEYGIPNESTLTMERKRLTTLTDAEKAHVRKQTYMWYARLNCPTRKAMKKIVGKLPVSCDIYSEDVDLLPWNRGGYDLIVKEMNKLFCNPNDFKEGKVEDARKTAMY